MKQPISFIKSGKIFTAAILLAAGLLIGVQGAWAATPAFVQVKATKTTSGTVNNSTFSQANGASNLIVVHVLWSNAGNVTLTDTKNNTYTAVAPATKFNNNQSSSQVFYAKNIAAATANSNTVKATFATAINSWAMVYAHEYSGMDKISPVDVFGTAIGTGTAMSGSLTTNQNNSLIFAAAVANNSQVTSAGAGFQVRSTLSQDWTMDKVLPTAGTTSVTANRSGNGIWVLQMVAFKPDTGDTIPPSIPTGLNATTSETQVNLSWAASTDNVGVTGYKIYRNGTQVGTSTSTSFADGNLSPNTGYNYTVSAYDAANNNSAQSSILTATTLADTTAPTTPLNLVANTVSDTQINLSWNTSTDNIGVAGYRIYRDGTEIATTSGSTFQNTGLTSSTAYSYAVAAFDSAGNNSAQSVAANATTQAPPDTAAPSIPANLLATAASTTQADLTWDASTDNVAVTGYKVFRDGTEIANNVTAASYQDIGRSPGVTYNYTASAFDAAGNNSAQSAAASVTMPMPPDNTNPEVAVTEPTLDQVVRQIINVRATATDNVIVNRVEFVVDNNLVATDTVGQANVYEFSLDTTTLANDAYTITATAFDGVGNSQVSSVSITVDNEAPTAPSSLTTDIVSHTHIKLLWNASGDNLGVQHYKVWRNNVLVANNVTDTFYNDTGLTANTAYDFEVRAYDLAGNESAGTTVSGTTPQAPDTTAPVLSNHQPTGTLPSGTQTATLSLDTNEPATCRHSTVPGIAYDAMTSTFVAIGNTHTDQLSGLANGQSYSYFVRCKDAANNASIADYTISFSVANPASALSYERVVVDQTSLNQPWMKGVGDFNGDGIADLMVAGEDGPVVWYETPTWTERQISATASSQSGSAVDDIDGDGDTDVIVGIVWFENINNGTSWTARTLPGGNANSTHDIAIADLNNDGKKDIAMRGEGNAIVTIFLQTNPTTWTNFTVDPGLGLNGLDLEDVNNDGRPDVVVGGRWMENPGGAIATALWPMRVVTNSWNGYAAVEVVDLNTDGRQDMVMSVSEEVGKLSWFEQLSDGTWLEHVIDTNLNSVHGVIVEDIDKDGLLDIVASEYHTPGDLTIYRNGGSAASWQPTVLGADGLHNLRAADFNGDCKLDFFGVHSLGINPVVAYRSTGPSACPPASSIFPLKPSTNGRYLTTDQNAPFLMMGDSPQGLIPSLTLSQVDTYFDNRAQNGFNTFWINLLARTQTGGPNSGGTVEGHLPFTGYLSGNLDNPEFYNLTTPNQQYFDKAKEIVRRAEAREMLVVLDPIETMDHLGILQRNGEVNARAYGQYLGGQFQEFDNIIWMHGNDFNTYMNNTDRTLVRLVGEGIRDIDSPNAMQTVLGFASPSEALDLVFDPNPDDTAWAPLINIDTVYTYGSSNGFVANEYGRASSYNQAGYSRGPIPVYLAETFYDFEEDAIDFRPNRKILEFRCQQYGGMLGGATGHTYGSYRTVNLDSGWNTANTLNTPAVANFKTLKTFFESKQWYNLVPDNSIMLSGTGSVNCGTPYGGSGGIDTSPAAAVSGSGSLAIVYMPSARTMTINMSRLNGTATARWFNPVTGTYTNANCAPSGANCAFTPPSTTHTETSPLYDRDGQQQETSSDWVLVLETGAADTQPPTVPTGLAGTATSATQVNLSWNNDSTDNIGVTGYTIYRDGAQVGITGSSATVTFQDSGLTASTTYNYEVSARDGAGNLSARTPVVAVTTQSAPAPDTTAPSIPADLNATAVSGAQINLTWPASTDNVGGSGLKQYRVYRSTDNAQFTELTPYPTTAMFSSTGLTPGTLYYFKVKAEDNAGNLSGFSSVASAATQTPPPVSAFLKAAWGFNEGSGASASDASNNGNTATVNGASPWAAGKYGSGLNFNGTGNYLSMPNSPSIDISGTELTLSLWLNPQQSPSADSVILGKFWHPSTWTDPYYQYGFEFWGSQPVFQIGTATGLKSVFMGSNVAFDGQWKHLAVVYNGTNAKFYLNGNLVSTQALSGAIVAKNNSMNLGADQSIHQFFKGGMDDVRIYNKALTQTEVQADMNTSM